MAVTTTRSKSGVAREKLIVALDMQPVDAVFAAAALHKHVGMFKVGLQLFIAGGPKIVYAIANYGRPVMLDLKLHDIPNTVTMAAVNALDIHHNVHWVTVHIAAGPKALAMAAQDVNDYMQSHGRIGGLVGITVLTSLDEVDAAAVGLDVVREGDSRVSALRKVVLQRARLATTLSGIVCSPQEVAAVRRVTDAKLIVPGIRPAGVGKDDQARTGTPAEAVRDGADFLVVGRAITAASNMVAAADAIVEEIAGALVI